MKPFNLEEAKAGKPFASKTRPELPGKFLAVSSRGLIVYERKNPSTGEQVVCSRLAGDLHMLPTKQVIYTTPNALFGLGGTNPFRSLRDIQLGGHAEAKVATTCSGCQHSGMTDAENPVLRIEWEE